ncbi:DNA cytosine methyltransferase [Senegalia sp. (in: firmicutes)]|uniref:DNA cytosine methyltransferase n=1 Tax=Senegalia sp. (in: firmicutes) TaxID=1924098 RepID=UPI003F9CC5EA
MLNYIDLFSGAGGMSLGFEKAGFKNIFSLEFNREIAETYKKNFPETNLIIKDIVELSETEIKEIIGGLDIDVVVGGPPCQGFSLAGKIGRTFIEDDRNYLFNEFVRVVSIVKPKIFIVENVARMASHNKGKTILEIINEFEKLGYNVEYDVLQTSDYGIPQKRQRIIIVGTRGSVFKFPEKNESVLTIKDAIDDLPRLKSAEKSNIPNHNAMNHSAQMLEKMSYIKDGGDRDDIPEELRPKTGDARKYICYNSKKPSPTVTGDMRKIFHYEQNRALTQRELARLQTFPDDFIFVGNSMKIQQEIGNAVPPKLAYKLALQVKKGIK